MDFLHMEMVLVFKQYVNVKWCSSLIRIPYNQVISIVLQYATHVEGGMVVRRSNNVLIFMSNQFDPINNLDGVEAMAVPPSGHKVKREVLVLQKETAPAS